MTTEASEKLAHEQGKKVGNKPEKKKVRYWSFDEIVWAVGDGGFSPLLFIVSSIVWALRRTSIFEIFKWLFLRKTGTPAWFLDGYLLGLWTGTAVAVGVYGDSIPNWFRYVFLFIIAQVVQTSIYHELLRPHLLSRRGSGLAISYSRLRNLLVGFGNFVYVNCLFGLVYWLTDDKALGGKDIFKNPLDAVFFAFTSALTIGNIDVTPDSLSSFVKLVFICQFIVTLFLGSIIIATSTSGIKLTGELSHGEERKSDSGDKPSADGGK